MASVSYITSEHFLQWDIGWQFCFLSYFLMGYKIRKWAENRKSNKLAILLILGGAAVNAALGCVNYIRGSQGLAVDVILFSENPFSYAPLAPLEVVASCLIFAGFSTLKSAKNYSRISRHMFFVYLVHIGIWEVMYVLIRDMLPGELAAEFVSVIVCAGIVFLASLIASVCVKKISSRYVGDRR